MASTHSVYLFRHVRTQQVLVSTNQALKNKALQQFDVKTQPYKLRKDLWRPMLALTGFDCKEYAQAVSDALLHRVKAAQEELKSSKAHLDKARRLRVPEEMKLIETSIVSLRESLESVGRPESKLLALWEQPRFMELKGDAEWPSYLTHGQLLLKNNRFVKEEETSS